MDFYLNTENSYNRLLEEFHKYKSLVVAFDFDNTVFDYHKKGLDFSDIIQLLRNLKSIGCYLIIFTATDDEKFVTEYCQSKKIPFDVINKNPPFHKSNSPKIYYNALLDDRAGLKETYDLLNKLYLSTVKE